MYLFVCVCFDDYIIIRFVLFQLIKTKRTEDAASQVQRVVEDYCKVKEAKGLAVRGKWTVYSRRCDIYVERNMFVFFQEFPFCPLIR